MGGSWASAPAGHVPPSPLPLRPPLASSESSLERPAVRTSSLLPGRRCANGRRGLSAAAAAGPILGPGRVPGERVEGGGAVFGPPAATGGAALGRGVAGLAAGAGAGGLLPAAQEGERLLRNEEEALQCEGVGRRGTSDG